MGRINKNSIMCFALICFMGMFALGGCAQKVARSPSGALDTPEHHCFSGLKLLDQGEGAQALREFNLALDLDSEYSPAHLGKGLALGKKGDFEAAFEAVNQAKNYSKDEQEEANAYVGFIRLYTYQKGDEWLENAEDYYGMALSFVEDMPEAHFYMGMAYKEAYRFEAAEAAFKKVLAVNKALVGEADGQLKMVQKVLRALPGTEVGKKLALEDKITRADCAAILINELRLDKIYQKEKKLDPAPVVSPEDIQNHPLRTSVEAVIRIGLRGLEVMPDEKFHPDSPITRAAYAMMMEDIIATITHDKELMVKHIGAPSPFPDVQPDAPYYNAVLVCTTRGIMEAGNLMTGHFDPEGNISGSEALLVIRKLKEELKIF